MCTHCQNRSWDPWTVPGGIASGIPAIPPEIPIGNLECPRWDPALILRLDPVNPTFISGWDPTCAGGIPSFTPEIPDGIEGIPP